ncbi:MAG: ribbon-helix-helix protein, CopG family [Patescibacteria group bacterium]|nr:ribbon-helix-helix protein, CopG family [Patescibacteria group bacterium]MDE1988140.1 ribbon-helix-helix protein, CopG family [Patescibacteria group bacterium]MDE2218000.1 ribbon-helix-helix protein, CopG family [Patescibacteria group bacterium]
MRSVINISLPKSMADLVEKEVKKGKFATKSEFFRMLIREREEGFLLKELKESQKEIAKGEGKILRSLKDLR